MYVCGVVLLTGIAWFNDAKGVYQANIAWEYCNPIVILLAVLTFLAFQRLKIRNSRLINELARGSFTVFLLHGAVQRFLHIEKYVTSHVLLMLAHMLVSSLGIYLLCWVAYKLYSLVADRALRLLGRRLPILTKDLMAQFPLGNLCLKDG